MISMFVNGVQSQDVAVLLMAVVFFAWTTYIRRKFGVLYSISASFYAMEENKKNSGWWFLGFCWGMAAPLAVFIEVNGLFFIPMVALVLLGAAPQYKRTKMTKTMHFIGSYGVLAGFLVVIGFAFQNWWPLISAVLVIRLLMVTRVANRTWWVEYSDTVIIMIALLIR